MAIDKSLMAGSTGMLILKLLSREDMYGYQMIESLAALSDDTFSLKAGTLYPLLHNMEENGLVSKEQTLKCRSLLRFTNSDFTFNMLLSRIKQI